MLYKQTIRAGEVREIYKEGRHLKLINAQTSLGLRVFKGGSSVLDTEIRSGFELAFKSFDKITITADQEQKIELWASETPLGYDAPSSNANSLNSYAANHYGDTDEILPFEPSRLTTKVVSDQPWWYGGSNVTKANGIPVAAGEVAEIRGAAAISAAISAKGEYLPSTQTVSVASGKSNYAAIANEHGMFAITNDNKLMQLDSNGYREIAPKVGQGDYVYAMCLVGVDKIAYAVQYSNYFYELDLVTGKVKNYRIPNTDIAKDGYVQAIRRMTHDGEKYIFVTSGQDRESGYDQTFAAITTLQDGVWTHRFRDIQTNYSWRQIWAIGLNKVIIQSDLGFKLIEDVTALPAEDDVASLTHITGIIGGQTDYMQFTEYGDYILIQGQSINSEAVLINKVDMSVVSLGYCDASAIAEAGVILVKGNEFHTSTDLGQTFEITDHPLSFSSSHRNYLHYVGSHLFIMASSFTGYYVTEKVRETPKQTFRVLKAFS